MTDEEAIEVGRIARATLKHGPPPHRNDYDDIVQEITLQILRYADPLPENFAFRKTIFKRAIWVALRDIFGSNKYIGGRRMMLKKSMRWQPEDMANAFAADPDPADAHAMLGEACALLRGTIWCLSCRERAVLCWHADGVQGTEIGRRLGVTLSLIHI